MVGISWIGFFTFLQSAIFVVGYISNNSLFPEPLTAEDESFYLNKMEERRWGSKKYFNRKKFEVSCSCV